MSATTFSVESRLPRTTTMTSFRLRHAYLTETKFECLRALRAPAFAIPFLLLPLVLYVLFGVLLAGSMSKGGVHSGWGAAGTLTIEDADAMRREIPGVSAVSPELRSSAQVSAGNQNWGARKENPPHPRCRR